VADTIKCICEHCGAKYRLPLEAQGRSARCKRCGERFEIPKQQSLEDSVLTWLSGPEEEEAVEEETPMQPRVISMPTKAEIEAEAGEEPPAEDNNQSRGFIRMKSGTSAEPS